MEAISIIPDNVLQQELLTIHKGTLKRHYAPPHSIESKEYIVQPERIKAEQYSGSLVQQHKRERFLKEIDFWGQDRL